MGPTPLEMTESVEMMRFLEHGWRVRAEHTEHHTVAVDTPEDLDRVQGTGCRHAGEGRHLCVRNYASVPARQAARHGRGRRAGQPQIVLAGEIEGAGLLEIKEFCVHDGAATWAGSAAGLIQVVISGRDSAALRKRLDRMQIDAAFLGDVNKLRALERLEDYDVTRRRSPMSATTSSTCRSCGASACRSRWRTPPMR